ncbi:hypothetical protein B7494_g3716 [Chlorociboria aeruginascens]|nr:hypothetical protein B7494_g3716 [Chlorociboria aeruginascens]
MAPEIKQKQSVNKLKLSQNGHDQRAVRGANYPHSHAHTASPNGTAPQQPSQSHTKGYTSTSTEAHATGHTTFQHNPRPWANGTANSNTGATTHGATPMERWQNESIKDQPWHAIDGVHFRDGGNAEQGNDVNGKWTGNSLQLTSERQFCLFTSSIASSYQIYLNRSIEHRRDATEYRAALEVAKTGRLQEEISKAKSTLDQLRRRLQARALGLSTSHLRSSLSPKHQDHALLEVGGLMLLWTCQSGFGNLQVGSEEFVFDYHAEERSQRAMEWLLLYMVGAWTLLVHPVPDSTEDEVPKPTPREKSTCFLYRKDFAQRSSLTRYCKVKYASSLLRFSANQSGATMSRQAHGKIHASMLTTAARVKSRGRKQAVVSTKQKRAGKTVFTFDSREVLAQKATYGFREEEVSSPIKLESPSSSLRLQNSASDVSNGDSEDISDSFSWHSSSTDGDTSMKSLVSFICGDIPIDAAILQMRKQIWGFASYNIQPRLMKVKEVKTDTDTTQKFEIIGARRPILLTVCKEAFAEMTFRRGYKLLFKVAGSNKRIFFSPQIDIIELSSVFEVPKLLFSDSLEKKMDIGSITHVIVGANYLNWSSTSSSITSLVFVVNELIALMFGLPPDSQKLTLIYALRDGQLKEDVDAISEIFKHLIDDEQKQHLMEIWSSFNQNFEEFTSLASLDEGFATNNSWPTRVNISIGYLSTVVN